MSGPWINGPLVDPGAIGITGGSITGVTGVPNDIGVSGISVGIAPTGSMANNGAVTLGTALDRIYTEGLYLYYPASAISAGSTAGFYWTVMSSTTVGTVFNSTYTTGVPVIGTQTAFATTGPGAFTGVITEQGVTIPIAASGLGLMGAIVIECGFRNINSAGAKTFRVRWSGSGGTVLQTVAETTANTFSWAELRIFNATTASQTYQTKIIRSSGSVAMGTGNTSVDTSVATSVFVSLQLATATDYHIMSSILVRTERSA